MRTTEELKDLVTFLLERGAREVKVGDLSAFFGPIPVEDYRMAKHGLNEQELAELDEEEREVMQKKHFEDVSYRSG